MKNNWNYRCLGILVILLFFYILEIGPHSAFGKQSTTKGLTCTVAIDRSEIIVGEPVLVHMSLKNESDTALILNQPLGELYGTAIVQIKRPTKKRFEKVYTKNTGLVDLLGFRTTLAPGETMVAFILLLCDNYGEFVLNKPGLYELRASMGLLKKEVISEEISIVVKQPAIKDYENKIRALKEDLAKISLVSKMIPSEILPIENGLKNKKQFKEILQFVKAFAEINSSSANDKDKGVTNLKKLVNFENILWKELAMNHLALFYAQNSKADKAKEMLSKLDYRSSIKDKAQQILNK